jgi:hypothetical protein
MNAYLKMIKHVDRSSRPPLFRRQIVLHSALENERNAEPRKLAAQADHKWVRRAVKG